MAELIINDRRGQKKPPREDIPAQLEATADPNTPVDKSSWKSTALIVVVMQTPQRAMVLLGRATGLRSDEELFVADWQFPPMWTIGCDWTKYAKERLDTFLNCGCGHGRMCGTHEVYIRNWQKADAERLQAIGTEPVPEVIERLVMAEKSARPLVEVPR